MYRNRFFIIKAVTNIHVGSGEQTFSVVDNMVQRDPVTQMPMIQSSSLKGALRDFALMCRDAGKIDHDVVNRIFGYEGEGASTPGEFRFMQANLLALPVRSNQRPFYLAVTQEIIRDLVSLANVLNVNIATQTPDVCLNDNLAYITDEDVTDIQVEDFDCQPLNVSKAIRKLFNYEHIALFNDKTFKQITCILPVIARNKLGKDGTSENLFYEEVIPRQSLFGFFIGMPELKKDEQNSAVIDGFEQFIELMCKDVVQIGANASIGYGLSEIREVSNE